MSADVLAAGTAFRKAGICVVPAAADGSKRPGLPAWKVYQASMPKLEQVRAWLGNDHADGYGVICGKVSGNLEMLEFEGLAVAEHTYQAWMAILADHGMSGLWRRIVAGYAEETPGGGLHFLYRVNGHAKGNTKLARRPATADELSADSADKIKVLIETRGEGGFVIVAPSGGRTHPTGRAWRLGGGGPGSIVTITEAERDGLYRVAALLDQMPASARLPRVPALRTGDELRPGDDYAARTTWAELLEPAGWRRLRSLPNGWGYWQRPGKDGAALSATTREDGGLYVFSTSTEFEAEVPYSKFGAYAQLHHRGDHKAAAAQLRHLGYGAPRAEVARGATTPASQAPPAERPPPDQDEAFAALVDGHAEPAPKPPTPAEARKATPAAVAKATPAKRLPIRSAFPVPDEAMFYGVAGEIVNSVDPYTEACRPAVLTHLLAGCGVMIGRGPRMVAGWAVHPPGVWALVVGGTSLGAKGTASATADAFLRAADSDFMTDRVLPAVSTGEGLIHLVRDPTDGDEGAPDKRLLVLLPEFRTVMAQGRRDTNTLTATLRQAWDSPYRLSIPTRNQPEKATGALIVMVADVTPGEFRAKVDPSEIAGGSLNRFLFIASRTSKDLPDEPEYPREELDGYAKRLREAIDAARDLGEKRLQFTLPARQLWKSRYTELKNPLGAQSEDEEGLIASVVTRARPHVMRVALTYALLDQAQVIDDDHLAAALALWKYSLDSALWLFRTASPDLIRLQQFIDDAGPAGRSRADISNLFGRHLDAKELDRLLDQLGSEYEIRTIPTSGRSRTVYARTSGETSEESEEAS
jgi:Protein of unknown function (DUF3987)/Bifunctional DNA primase/polymerase, N-terminal